jgi:hypothetical protein
MRILIRNIMLSVVSLLALSACSNDDSDTLARVPLTIKATIQGAETRVADNGDGSESFEEDDVIYVTKLTSSGNADGSYCNIKYTYNGTEFKSSETYYFETDGSSVTFVASNFTNSQAYASISYADQTKGLGCNYFNAKVSCSMRNPEANFEFKHCLSKMTLKFSSNISSCTLSGTNIYKYGFIYSGSIIADDTSRDGSAESVKCYVSPETYKTAEATLIPCSTSAEISVEVVAEGKIYKGTIPSTSIVANTHYIYNIKISDVLTVDNGTSITGFEDSGTTFEAEQN